MNKTTIPRRNRYNSEKVGQLTLIYIFNRFENIDSVAITQEDAIRQEQSQKLNECQKKNKKEKILKIKVRKSFRIWTRKLQRDKVGEKIRQKINLGSPLSEYLEFPKRQKRKHRERH